MCLKRKKRPPEIPDYESIRPTCVLVVKARGRVFYANFEKNAAAGAWKEKLQTSSVTVGLRDDGEGELTGALPWELPRSDEPLRTTSGDILLSGENRITICREEKTGTFTRLARIGSGKEDELRDVLLGADAQIYLEWGE